jgi:broad specificity phosphatase PhoE
MGHALSESHRIENVRNHTDTAPHMSYAILTRHGRTPTNEQAKEDRRNKIIVGPLDEPLSKPKGEEEADEEGITVRQMSVDFNFKVIGVVSSDAPRAVDTGTRIAKQLKNPKSIWHETDTRFRERDPGDFMKRKEIELMQEYPDYFGTGPYSSWQADYEISAPKGENYTVLEARVLPAMYEWIAIANLADDEAFILSTHMHPTRVALGELLKLPRKLITQLPIENATPYLIRLGEKNELLGEETKVHQMIREYFEKESKA